MHFNSPHELAGHLYDRATRPHHTTDERVRIAHYAARFALEKWEEYTDE